MGNDKNIVKRTFDFSVRIVKLSYLKEARETNYWLRLLIAAEVIPKDKITDLLRESREIAKIIAQIIIHTKNNE